MSADTEYQDELNGLAGAVGCRNARLLRIANLGVLSGRNTLTLTQEIQAASGFPQLGEREVRRAVERAARDTKPNDFIRLPYRPSPPPPPPEPWKRGAAAFVWQMCKTGQGADMATLTALSPVTVPPSPQAQAVTFLHRLYEAEEFIFIGEQYTTAQIGKTLCRRDDWLEASSRITTAPQIIANPLTGLEGLTKDGTPSLRCLDCIFAFRYALVEFDAMPLEGQLAFWTGIVKSDALPVVSIVFSGKKSVHGLIRLDASDATHWARYWRDLEQIIHPDSVTPEFKADAGCKDATRQTRLPGAVRRETGKLQSLLWLA